MNKTLAENAFERQGRVRLPDGSWSKPLAVCAEKNRDGTGAQPKADRKAEKELQRQIYCWLETQNIFAGMQRMDKKSNIRLGYPDIWFVIRAHPVALECKSTTGAQTIDQITAMHRMLCDGWDYRICRSLQEVVELVTLLKASKG